MTKANMRLINKKVKVCESCDDNTYKDNKQNNNKQKKHKSTIQ